MGNEGRDALQARRSTSVHIDESGTGSAWRSTAGERETLFGSCTMSPVFLGRKLLLELVLLDLLFNALPRSLRLLPLHHKPPLSLSRCVLVRI